MRRIQADSPPRTGRADVPESLERLLRQTLAKNPDARPQRALDLARELQAIEQELHLPHTQVVVPDDNAAQPGGPGPHTPGHDFTTRFGDSTVARPGRRFSAWDPGPGQPGAAAPAGAVQPPRPAAGPGGWPSRGGDDDETRQRAPRVLDPRGFTEQFPGSRPQRP